MLSKIIIIVIVLVVAGYFVFSLLVRPSLDRNWTRDQQILARAEISGNTVAISNIRNITYRTTSDYDVHYYDKTFALDKLESVWYVVGPFSGHGAGAAHTFLSFGF